MSHDFSRFKLSYTSQKPWWLLANDTHGVTVMLLTNAAVQWRIISDVISDDIIEFAPLSTSNIFPSALLEMASLFQSSFTPVRLFHDTQTKMGIILLVPWCFPIHSPLQPKFIQYCISVVPTYLPFHSRKLCQFCNAAVIASGPFINY